MSRESFEEPESGFSIEVVDNPDGDGCASCGKLLDKYAIFVEGEGRLCPECYSYYTDEGELPEG